ncbi:hypothetical protein EVJ32_09620 [Exiguobacterium sp. SH5S4]|uniref:hypothetical protein n=1 Tax=Exiguobacterium sp. SH5S4 TaxID=2510961 RepID=UPI00103E3A92|nr:hypothetical protein [Exiguobacterium sp. SH5S4]TCI25570.1 hypothetical protein EVJ32_09620 [Exiguobacterium sp. SH5S4]
MTEESKEHIKPPRKEKRLELPKTGFVTSLAEDGPEQIVPLGTVVYIGPPLKTVSQFAVFSNGLPESLELARVECPAIGGLIIPTKDLNEATIALKRTGSKESILFEQVKKHLGSEV